jgi:MFS superfamily sulfate permease-like transporter
MATLVIFVTFALISVLYVVLPGLFVLFYRSPHVVATCRTRHPEPQWIDDCPRRLLTLTVVWVLLAISVLLMPAYDFFFPLFGIVLTGAAGAGLWAVVLACCVSLAMGTCRRARWAWTGGVALTLAATLSSVLTVLRFDLAEMMVLMRLPQDQVAMVDALPMLDGWVMVLANMLLWGTFIVYLMTLRRYFRPGAMEVDA